MQKKPTKAEKEKKIGHRRVGVGGEITYKKVIILILSLYAVIQYELSSYRLLIMRGNYQWCMPGVKISNIHQDY